MGFRGVGVEAADNDTGVDRSVDDVLQSVSVVAADQDAVDLLFDQALNDGDLLAGVRGGRADPLQVDAQLLGLGLGSRLAVKENSVVQRLGNDSDGDIGVGLDFGGSRLFCRLFGLGFGRLGSSRRLFRLGGLRGAAFHGAGCQAQHHQCSEQERK